MKYPNRRKAFHLRVADMAEEFVGPMISHLEDTHQDLILRTPDIDLARIRRERVRLTVQAILHAEKKSMDMEYRAIMDGYFELEYHLELKDPDEFFKHAEHSQMALHSLSLKIGLGKMSSTEVATMFELNLRTKHDIELPEWAK